MASTRNPRGRRAAGPGRPRPPKPAGRRARFWTRKRLFRLHGWIGFNLGLLLFVICFSGVGAVLSDEMDWLLTPALRVEPEGERLGWEEIYDRAKAAYPDWRLEWIEAPMGERYAARLIMTSPHRDWRYVYVNPYTGEVQGSSSYYNAQRFFRDLHAFLFLPANASTIIGAFGVVLLFATLTGFLFYKNWWRNLFRLRVGKGARIFWADAHKLLGVWSLVFALVISVTGIWYLLEDQGWFGFGPEAPPVPEATLEAVGPVPPAPEPRIGEYIRAAREAYPELEPAEVWTNGFPRAPVEIRGQAGHIMVRNRANRVWLDPYTAEVLRVQRAEQLGPVERWQDTADPLHFGNFGGIATKLLWVIFGLCLPIGILTGAYISAQRGGRGESRLWRWVRNLATAAFLLYIASAIPRAIQEWYGPQPEPLAVAEARLGPWQFEIERRGPVDWGGDTEFAIDVLNGDWANYRSAVMWIGPDSVPPSEAATLAGAWYDTNAWVPTPRTADPDDALWLRIETWRDDVLTTRVRPEAWARESDRPNRFRPLEASAYPHVAWPIRVLGAVFLIVIAGVAVIWYRWVW